MKIESIRIQGFRSLSDLTFKPGAFTVLVGPNNAGKSNVVGALGFLSDVYAHGVKHAIEIRGGFENIAFREDGIPRREMSFDIVLQATLGGIRFEPPTRPFPDGDEADWFLRDRIVHLRHSFILRGQGEPLISEFTVEDEAIRIDLLRDDDRSLVLRMDRRERAGDIELGPSQAHRWLALPFFENGTEAEEILRRVMTFEGRSRDIVVRRLRDLSPLLAPFLEHLGSIKTYQLLPTMCRLPSSPTAEADLSHYGENLSSLVYFLKGQYPRMWEIVMQEMRLISPDLDDIDVQLTTDRRWTLEFKETGIGRHWSIDEVSDGSIRALGVFSAIYDPRGSLLAIEEPEYSLHPWILREVIAACRNVTSWPNPKQVVLTTHSPVLIDQLYPADVSVLWKERGQTMLRPLLELEPGVEEAWADGKIRLSGFLDSGLLRQTVPVSLG